jgi:opacity protein-like surface antigen
MKIRSALPLLLFTFLISPSASAADLRWYVGFEGSRLTDDLPNISTASVGNKYVGSAPTRNETLDVKDNKFSWSVVGGLKITPIFSVEAAYIDLGANHFRYNGEWFWIHNTGASYIPLTVEERYRNSAWGLRGIAQVPVANRLNLHALLGVMKVNSKASIYENRGGLETRQSQDSSSNGLTYGAGVGFELTEKWVANLDWSLLKKQSDDFQDQVQFTLISLGVRYHF